MENRISAVIGQVVKSVAVPTVSALTASALAGCALFDGPHQASNHFSIYGNNHSNDKSIHINGAKVYRDVVDGSSHILFAQVNGNSDVGNRVDINISPYSGNNTVIVQSDDSKHGSVYVKYSKKCLEGKDIEVRVESGLSNVLNSVGMSRKDASTRERLLSIEKANKNDSWGGHRYEFVYAYNTIHGARLSYELSRVPGEKAQIVGKSLPHVDTVVETVRLSCGNNGPTSSTTVVAASYWANSK